MDYPLNRKIIIATGLLTIVAGITVMLGWIFNVPALESIIHGFIAMSFNSALCFVLFGTALLITQYPTGKHNYLLFFILSLLGTSIGLITISQDLFHYNSGLDQLFATDKTIPSPNFPYPGRMAFNASVNFSFLGLGLLLVLSQNSIFRILSQFFFHMVAILSAVALIGYLYGVSFFRVFLYRTSMATHTAIIFFFLSLAACLLNPSIGMARLFTGKKVGNQMARRLFTLMIIMIIIFGLFRIPSQHSGLFPSLDIEASLLAVGFLMVSLLLIWNTAGWLNSIDKKRSEAEDEVRKMNANLEKLVQERAAEYQKSEEKYRSLIEQASDAIFVIDNKGSIIDANASMCRMVGYAHDELLTINVESILDPEELKIEPLEDRILTLKDAAMRERQYVRKNGEVFPVEINLKKFADDSVMIIARDITGRKKMEAELREAELKFRTIADKSMVGVYIAQKGKFTYVNPRFAAVFGYETTELINTFPVETIFHESFRATALENVRKRIAGEVESVHYEAMGLKKDGTPNWVEFYGSRAIIGGEPAIMGSMIDITERKQAEEGLRSSELKYKLLFESSPMPMWMIAKDDQTIIAVNEATATQYGYSKEELLHMDLRDFRPAEDSQVQSEGYRMNFDHLSEPVTVRHLKKDGALMFVQISARDIVFEGRPVRLSMTLDITERLRAEESLKKSEANLQTILKNTDTAYVLCDPESNILAFNPKAADFVKERYHEILARGEKLLSYFPKIRFPKFAEYTREVLGGNAFSYEVDYPQADGSVYWYFVKLVPITNNGDEILGLMIAFYDITERKNAEQHLKDAYGRIQAHIDSIKEMAWKQSHLIRSPLANLKGLAAMLKEDPGETTIFEHMEQEINRMDTILIDMAEEASHHD
ncbi:MAG TPA: PAS domain S-box protein [Mucilaginibacter sp.]|jgi:PAS domain S-box-containing protein|nr:PAS domain S-box protein [Mucilaginibacter sp.]